MRETTASVFSFGAIDPTPFHAALSSLGVRVGDGGHYRVVLADDYLHAGLDAFNQESLIDDRPWLLVKPVGIELWIGPLFRPRKTGCWACLAHRLRGVRKVESFVREKTNTPDPPALPLAVLPSTLRTALSLAATETAKWVVRGQNECLEGRVVTFNVLSLDICTHVLVRRPQCTRCGDPRAFTASQSAPLVLQSRKKVFTSDGGHRSFAPEETLQTLGHHISPITGIVGALRPLSPQIGGKDLTPSFVATQNFFHMPQEDSLGLDALSASLRSSSGGKGKHPAQAKASALCEAIERYSGTFQGDEFRLRARLKDLGTTAVHPNACMLYSERQLAQRAQWNARGSRSAWVPEQFDTDSEVEWSPAWSLTYDQRRWIPTAYCYYGYSRKYKTWFARADSNGCAAGRSKEEAILQGFMELVERDSVALWWYNRFHIPQKLYGRARDIEALLAAFVRASRGAGEMMLVSGYAGIGKSALVHEVYRSVTQQGGYFVSGKFDQFQRDIPYAPLAQAFRSLVRQILTESEDQIVAWRKDLVASLAPNLQVVVDVVPELELIVGPQPAVPPRPPTEAQNRFHLTFQNFIRVFAKSGRPLVLFLDDLQWADTASLNLLQSLMTATENRYLLVIGAYRDNEVRGTHPLRLTLDEIRKGGGTVEHIVLGPLSLPDIQQLLADTLKHPPEGTKPLAELVLAKTNGNPFFIGEFLKALYTEGLLTFDTRYRSWRWDVSRIKAQNITDNVVELMADKVQNLRGETRKLLKLAACLGSQFDLRTLVTISAQSPAETAANLWSALAEGLLVPLSDAYKLMELDVQGLIDEVAVEYKFAHDRIQQAAYSLIPQTEKQVVHQRIGQLLLQNTPPDERERKIFTIVNHLNMGRGLRQRQPEREELAVLNLTAGKRAKAAAAYEPAFKYLQVGVELLSEDTWERQYDLALALHVEAAEAAYLSGDFQQMEQLTAVVLRKAGMLLDRVKAYEVMLHAYSTQNNLVEGARTGLRVLELLGERLPEEPSQADILRGLEEVRQAIAERRIEELLNLPAMTDPHSVATMRILSSMLNLSYTAFPKLFPLVVFRMVRLSAKDGNMPFSAHAYATYGIILCGAVGDIDTGYRFGTLATNLVEQLNARELRASVTYMVQTFIRHWEEHIRETLQPLLEGYQIGLETGDLIFGTFNAQGYGFQAFWMGAELGGLEREMAKYSDAMRSLKQGQALKMNEIYRQLVLNLLGRADDPCRLIGECYDEEATLRQANDANTLCFIFSSKVVLCCLFQEYRQAIAHAGVAEQYLDGLLGTAAIPAFYFYDSLARLAVFPEAGESERNGILERVAANQEKLRLWAQHAPMNFLHKFRLVEAERARVLGNESGAREYYDRAIDLAREHGYVNEEALAGELAAKFYLARGQTRIALYYLRDAHYAYLRWGALAKVKDLEARYPQFLTQAVPDFPWTTSSTLTTNTGQRLSTAFDLTSVLKASQAISREIRLDALLTTLMKTVVENAGAQKGFLILEEDGRLLIEAEGAIDRTEVTVSQPLPVEASPELPAAMIHYVARTKEHIVLGNATHEGLFVTDPYVVRTRPQSVLCAPILRQGELLGIIYLENNATTDAFTPDHLAVLNLLAVQAAISIENARLYRRAEEAKKRLEEYSRTLELKVEQRTRQLQKRNQELELANQQVQEANRRKSQFLAGMSHELRTPMNAILGFTRLVLRRAGDLLPERQRDNLLKVKDSADQLLGLINQLLDLSRLEAGRMEVHPGPFEVRRFILSCCELVSPLIKPGVQLRQEIAGEVGEADTDEEGLRHVVLNLLSNAIKFTDAGEVVIRVGVTGQTDGDASIVIAVSDTGVGIPADALETIFEEFQQVEGGIRRHEGTGLGLPIAKRWAELLGGTIRVESELGRGSTFTVTIPLVYRERHEASGRSAEQ